MKHYLSKTNKVYVWIYILVASDFFGLYQKIAPFTNIYFTDMIAVLLLFFSLVFFISKEKRKYFIIHKKIRTESFVQFFLILAILETIVSLIHYCKYQSLFDTIKKAVLPFAIVALFYSLREIANTSGILYIINVIIKVSFICSVVAITAYLLLETSGNNFFNLDINNYSFYRYNKPHFMIGSMITIPGTIFAWQKCIKCKNNRKIIDILTLVLGLIHIIYIGKTRTLIAYLIMTMLITFIYNNKRTRNIKLFFVSILMSFILLIKIDTFIILFTKLLLDNSVTYRLNGIKFYLNQLGKYPLLGMGFINSNNPVTKVLLYGPNNQYYRTDVGFIGFINEFGIIGGIWFVTLLFYAYKIMKKTNTINSNEIVIYTWGFLIFLILSSVSLFSVDPFRIFYMPLFLILLEYVEKMCQKT